MKLHSPGQGWCGMDCMLQLPHRSLVLRVVHRFVLSRFVSYVLFLIPPFARSRSLINQSRHAVGRLGLSSECCWCCSEALESHRSGVPHTRWRRTGAAALPPRQESTHLTPPSVGLETPTRDPRLLPFLSSLPRLGESSMLFCSSSFCRMKSMLALMFLTSCAKKERHQFHRHHRRQTPNTRNGTRIGVVPC